MTGDVLEIESSPFSSDCRGLNPHSRMEPWWCDLLRTSIHEVPKCAICDGRIEKHIVFMPFGTHQTGLMFRNDKPNSFQMRLSNCREISKHKEFA